MDRAAFDKGAAHDKPAVWLSRKQAVKGLRLIRQQIGHCHKAEQTVLETRHRAEFCLAQFRRPRGDRFKHRLHIGRRPGDYPQHLSSRGLLVERLARRVDEPRVFHRDDRLRREILQQRGLFLGERADLLAVDVDRP